MVMGTGYLIIIGLIVLFFITVFLFAPSVMYYEERRLKELEEVKNKEELFRVMKKDYYDKERNIIHSFVVARNKPLKEALKILSNKVQELYPDNADAPTYYIESENKEFDIWEKTPHQHVNRIWQNNHRRN